MIALYNVNEFFSTHGICECLQGVLFLNLDGCDLDNHLVLLYTFQENSPLFHLDEYNRLKVMKMQIIRLYC